MSVKPKKNIFDKLLNLPVYVNLLAIGAVLCLMVYLVLKFVDIYTNHNQAVVVPDVRGLQIEEAEPFLRKNMLKYVLIDSIYSKDHAPGAIVEMMPGANAKVKKNRTVLITVNAKTEKKATIPEVSDISYREAALLLRSRGFTDIEYKYVSGPYRDLAIGVQYGGQMVQSGTRVPLSAKLILVISEGDTYYQDTDTTGENSENNTRRNEGDEDWF
ncbi:MAG: PASTA domain-containing protein [Tannerella sp.]|jgi:beta-lactam-binding protein with PASTA domain|nr:PASTA domain-containing protein [Tannerella sp.]